MHTHTQKQLAAVIRKCTKHTRKRQLTAVIRMALAADVTCATVEGDAASLPSLTFNIRTRHNVLYPPVGSVRLVDRPSGGLALGPRSREIKFMRKQNRKGVRRSLYP